MISGMSTAAAGHEELIERVAALGRDKFAGRADRYDREAIFPADDFEDLFRRPSCALRAGKFRRPGGWDQATMFTPSG